MNEVWKEIADFQHYEISNLGRVRKIAYLGLSIPKSGYPQLSLYKGDGHRPRVNGKGRQKQKKMFLHRLVAQYFLPNPNNYPYVNHSYKDVEDFKKDISSFELHNYHEDWNKLMDVVEKIEKMNSIDTDVFPCYDRLKGVYTFEIGCNSYNVGYGENKSKINSVWQAVVQFIQWFNQQNKTL